MYVRSFEGADCGTDYYLMVTKVTVRIAVRKEATQKFDEEKWNSGNSIRFLSQTLSQIWRT